MNPQLAFDILRGIGSAIGIGLAFFVIPFGLLLLARMLPWFIWGVLLKSKFIRNDSTMSDYPLDKTGYNKQVYIDNCHPTQVIKRLKSDGLQSLFINYVIPQTPIDNPDTLCDKETPINLLNSTNPIPINNKQHCGLNHSLHADNLPQDKSHVNQNRTIPTKPFMLPAVPHSIFARRPQVTGNRVLAASAAGYRISRYTL